MPAPNKPRRAWPLLACAVFFSALVLSSAALFSSPGTDRLASFFFSRNLGARVTVEGARWKPPAGIEFRRATVESSGKKGGVVCGPGRLQYRWVSGSLTTRLALSGVSFSEDLLSSIPALGLEGRSEADRDALYFREAAFLIDGSGTVRRLRILTMRSGSLDLKGSLWWKLGRFEKASLSLVMPAEWARRLPDRWDQRLSSLADDKKVLKCAYNNEHLTFYGRSGPLFRAVWVPEP